MSVPMNELELTVKHLQDQLELANSRMQAVNVAFQGKVNDCLELHAQFLLLQNKNAQLMKQVEELEKQVAPAVYKAEEKA